MWARTAESAEESLPFYRFRVFRSVSGWFVTGPVGSNLKELLSTFFLLEE